MPSLLTAQKRGQQVVFSLVDSIQATGQHCPMLSMTRTLVGMRCGPESEMILLYFFYRSLVQIDAFMDTSTHSIRTQLCLTLDRSGLTARTNLAALAV